MDIQETKRQLLEWIQTDSPSTDALMNHIPEQIKQLQKQKRELLKDRGQGSADKEKLLAALHDPGITEPLKTWIDDKITSLHNSIFEIDKSISEVDSSIARQSATLKERTDYIQSLRSGVEQLRGKR